MYGAVKLCTYLVSRQLAQGAGLRFAWVRLFSAYGPKDSPDWMIQYVIHSLLRREKPSLTLGEQKWDYIHVEDVARAIYHIAKNQCAEGVFNLGSGQAIRLREIVETVRDIVDPSLPLGFGDMQYRSDQVMHLQANITKLRSAGWEPRVSLTEGLRETVEWVREHADRYH
jgi:nucleoside-diphosphate-sugar epimerase